jgi:hypothetical protein
MPHPVGNGRNATQRLDEAIPRILKFHCKVGMLYRINALMFGALPTRGQPMAG